MAISSAEGSSMDWFSERHFSALEPELIRQEVPFVLLVHVLKVVSEEDYSKRYSQALQILVEKGVDEDFLDLVGFAHDELELEYPETATAMAKIREHYELQYADIYRIAAVVAKPHIFEDFLPPDPAEQPEAYGDVE